MKKTRAQVVRAMDMMVSCINNECIIDSWLMCGVADGDIKEDTTDEDIEIMGYTDDKTFKELLDLFIKLMYRAGIDGGLYCDAIVSVSRSITWE